MNSKQVNFLYYLLEDFSVVGANNTCGSHGHSRHRRAIGHHFQMCHRSDKIYIQCIANGKCALQLTVNQRTAYMKDELDDVKDNDT